MAKRRRAATRTKTTIVRAPAPIVRVTAPAAIVRRRRSGRRRRGGGRSNIGGGLVSNESVQMAFGGIAYGYAVKIGLIEKLPAIPIIGRTGAAALVLDYFARHGGGELCRRASRAAAAIAGYQLGQSGTITGDANTYVGDDLEGDDLEGYGDPE